MSDSDRGERSKTLEAFGYVSFFVAVGALYGWMFYDMGQSAARYRVEQQQASKSYTKDATAEVRAECARSETPAACKREIEDAAQERQRNEKDLEAQRGMSDWAFWLLVISAFQLPATLAALVFVKRTLDATLEAVEDTGKATEAMREANRIAADSLVQTNRAWLKVDVAMADVLKFEGDDPEVRGSVELTVTNIGARPATNVSITAQLIFTEALRSAQKQAALAQSQSELPDIGRFPNTTIFPNDVYRLRWNLGTGTNELSAFLKMFDFGDNERTLLLLSVIGCVHYRMPGSARFHQTGINYSIDKVPTPDRGPALFTEDLPIASDRLRLVNPFDGPGIID